MKGQIKSTHLVVANCSNAPQVFEKTLREEIDNMQEKGLEVEIQYSVIPGVGGYGTHDCFSALLIGRGRQ